MVHTRKSQSPQTMSLNLTLIMMTKKKKRMPWSVTHKSLQQMSQVVTVLSIISTTQATTIYIWWEHNGHLAIRNKPETPTTRRPFMETNFSVSKLNHVKDNTPCMCTKQTKSQHLFFFIYYSYNIEPCCESQKKNVDMLRKLFFFILIYFYLYMCITVSFFNGCIHVLYL